MDLRYIVPAPRTTNFGDYVIHHAVERMVERFAPRPIAVWDIEDGPVPTVKADCLLLPGITHLTVGERPALERLPELPFPTYCLSGCIWQPAPAPGFLLRTRVLHLKKTPPPDLRIARLMKPPIGARDPFTYQLLQRSGIETFYTGCATLHLPNDGVGDDGYVLFSLGRGRVREQTSAAARLAREHLVVGICHELGDEARYRAAGWTLPLVNWQGDIALYLSYFKRARVVVTGRLHGALPALAYGKRVFYFGTRDTRTTLLDDLGMPIHDWQELDTAVDRASSAFNSSLRDYYFENWRRLLHRIENDCLRPTRGVTPAPMSPQPPPTTAAPCVHA